MRKLISTVLAVAAAAVLLAGIGALAADKETHYAYVENQTNETLTMAFESNVDGMRAKNQVALYAGQVRRVDTRKLAGEVCAWRAPDFKPAEKVACRTLRPGEHWVIY